MQQQGVECNFAGSDSWVILSPIEQSIKRKIEAVGTPLKDWDINIYRGVLTGYNDAFIISTEKRDEILASCKCEEERKKTAELIRPYKRSSSGCTVCPLGLLFSRFYPNIGLMRFYRRIFIHINSWQFAFDSIVSIDNPQVSPLIPIPLDVPATKNRRILISRK